MTMFVFRHGMPVELADVPGSGASRIDPNATSGNPRHDTRSGKFGAGGGGAKKRTQAPANVDPHEYARMIAAVRDAAREFDDPQEGDIREFLAGRAKNVDQVDIAGFLTLVRQQRLSDIADLLDQQFRSSNESMAQGRRKVKVSAPKGFLRKALNNLQPSEVDQLVSVVTSRGHDEAEVKKFFEEKGHTVSFSDVEFDPEEEDRVEFAEAMRDAFREVEIKVNAPVTVNMPEPRPRRLVPQRDPETRLITGVQEEFGDAS